MDALNLKSLNPLKGELSLIKNEEGKFDGIPPLGG